MTAAASPANRRQSPRVNVYEMSVYVADREMFVSGDVSSGGVGFRIEELLFLGPEDPLRVEMKLPEGMGELSMPAKICHTRRLEDGSLFVGAVFEGLDELTQNPLDRYVEERHLRFRTPIAIASLV